MTTTILAADIADEQVRHWRYTACITAQTAWQAMDLPPQGYVSWPMVRREIVLHLMRGTEPARLAA